MGAGDDWDKLGVERRGRFQVEPESKIACIGCRGGGTQRTAVRDRADKAVWPERPAIGGLDNGLIRYSKLAQCGTCIAAPGPELDLPHMDGRRQSPFFDGEERALRGGDRAAGNGDVCGQERAQRIGEDDLFAHAWTGGGVGIGAHAQTARGSADMS